MHRRTRVPAGALAVVVVLAAAVLGPSAQAKVRDTDRDGLSNGFERLRSHTNPRKPDTDRDKLRDRYELRASRTSPRLRDTDRDFLTDGFEVRTSKTSPRLQDTDRDGTPDGVELFLRTNPRQKDKPLKGGVVLPPPPPPPPALPDILPPDTGITAGPTGTVGTSAASFSFTSSENGSSFECRIDGGAWGSCSSPTSYSGLAGGSHTFEVRATDVAGNSDVTPASSTWTVDTTAPGTSIGSGPSGTVASASASFSFSSTEAGSTFECRLDAAAWGSCSSPKVYSNLSSGSHNFRVRAIDMAGNTDASPASRTWTVNVPPPADTTPPDTSIGSGPSGTVASASASFSFSSTEAGSTFECRLDAGAWGSCSSPKVYSNLSNGSHTFDARATDAAANTDASPATLTWTVDVPPADTTPPDTSITSGPSGTTLTGSASFSFTSSEASSTFECRLDAGAWGSCSSPKAYSNLSNGSHTFDVRATDAAGNTDPSPASSTWTAAAPLPDTTPPETSITAGPSGTVASASASFSFSSTEAGSTFECRLDAGAWGSCSSPKAYSNLSNGSHTFDVRATDAAANTDASPATRTWTVNVPPADTTPPDTSITAGPSGTVASASASFSFSSTEAGSTFECRLDAGAWGSCSSPKAYSNLSNGSHTFDVRATDTAANTDASPATRTWTVNVTPTGGNNCIADPSACGFPDVETTGVTPGTQLTPVSGNVTLSTPGQVYENKLVTGSITVKAANVTIRNVKIVMTDFYGIRARTVDPSNVSNLLVENTEINMGGRYANNGIAFNHYTARRVLFHNGGDCASMGDYPVRDDQVTIEDSLCVIGPDTNDDGLPDNKTFCSGSSAHFDGFQSDGGWNLTIRHNTIRNPCSQTSAIIISSNTSPITNVTVQNNLMAGGGYTLYCNAGPDVPNETITGNRIARTYWPNGGYYGPFAGCGGADVFSGNVWDDSGAPAT